MEIELFYMLPFQRHKDEWFPDWMYVLNLLMSNILIKQFLIKIYSTVNYFSYYDLPVEEVRKLINAIDENRTEFNSPPFAPFISKKLRNLIETPEPDCEKDYIKQAKDEIENKLEQVNNELKQQIKEMQELLNNFIKTSKVNNNDKTNDKING